MADNPIPEDLLDSYEECRTALEDTTLQAPALNALRQLTLLIERIGRAESENAKLKAQVERMSAPVSDQEQADYANRLSDGDEDHPCDRLFDVADVKDLLDARLAVKEPAWGASENITVLL